MFQKQLENQQKLKSTVESWNRLTAGDSQTNSKYFNAKEKAETTSKIFNSTIYNFIFLLFLHRFYSVRNIYVYDENLSRL